jgi:hypothetical protein
VCEREGGEYKQDYEKMEGRGEKEREKRDCEVKEVKEKRGRNR